MRDGVVAFDPHVFSRNEKKEAAQRVFLFGEGT